jgi:hypothetical protein
VGGSGAVLVMGETDEAYVSVDPDGRRVLSVNMGQQFGSLLSGPEEGLTVRLAHADGESEWLRYEAGQWMPYAPSKRERQEAVPGVRDQSLGRRRRVRGDRVEHH